ncbi:hypothetical protein PM082_024514 [Marasmius tenuissimus]|nr:hypothetical protein PM082_024514 [Marasmius tenuissimus]
MKLSSHQSLVYIQGIIVSLVEAHRFQIEGPWPEAFTVSQAATIWWTWGGDKDGSDDKNRGDNLVPTQLMPEKSEPDAKETLTITIGDEGDSGSLIYTPTLTGRLELVAINTDEDKDEREPITPISPRIFEVNPRTTPGTTVSDSTTGTTQPPITSAASPTGIEPTQTGSAPKDGNTDKATILGGVTAGIISLVLFLVLGFLVIRYRRRQAQGLPVSNQPNIIARNTRYTNSNGYPIGSGNLKEKQAFKHKDKGSYLNITLKDVAQDRRRWGTDTSSETGGLRLESMRTSIPISISTSDWFESSTPTSTNYDV